MLRKTTKNPLILLFALPAITNAQQPPSLDPLKLQPIFKEMASKDNERVKQAQKAITEKAKEYQNISEANAIYHKKHPNNLRIKTPEPNFLGTAIQAYTTEKHTSTNDQDPHKNPQEWDSMKSKDKTCWFHKTTRRKVCEPS